MGYWSDTFNILAGDRSRVPRRRPPGRVATRVAPAARMAPAQFDARATWQTFVDDCARHGPVAADVAAGYCTVVAEGIDPGHPAGLRQALLDPPPPWRGHFRLIHAPNGTVGPDGLYGYVLVVVPARCATPIQAAAHSYGVDPDTYAQLQRRA